MKTKYLRVIEADNDLFETGDTVELVDITWQNGEVYFVIKTSGGIETGGWSPARFEKVD